MTTTALSLIPNSKVLSHLLIFSLDIFVKGYTCLTLNLLVKEAEKDALGDFFNFIYLFC